MVQPVPVSQYLHSSFTGFSTAVTSRISQQRLHDPHCRAFCFAGAPGILMPSLSRTSRFCFSSHWSARSTLRRDNPVASTIPRIVVAPLSTARATFEMTWSILLLLVLLVLGILIMIVISKQSQT